MTSSLVHVNPVDADRRIRAAASGQRRVRAPLPRGRRGVDEDENEEARYARYEWFYQPDGRGNFTRASVEHGTRELLQRPLRGRGHFEFQTGEVTVKCGPFRQTWIYPAGFSLGRSPKHADPRLEAAQTKARDIGEVDVNDPRVTWYRYRLGPPPDFTRPIDQLY